MSIFRADGVVLQVVKFSEKELLYKIFFREYGILSVKKKKKTRERPIDISYYISSEILTKAKQDIHTIGNIKILDFFDTKNTSYSDIEHFLTLLSRVYKELPHGTPHYEIYDILCHLIKNSETVSWIQLTLTELKITQCLWNLPENHSDMTTQKILKFLHTHHYKDILRLWNIPQETQKILEKIL